MFPDGGFKDSGLEVIKRDNSDQEEKYDVIEGFNGPIILENVKGSEILDKIATIKEQNMKR